MKKTLLLISVLLLGVCIFGQTVGINPNPKVTPPNTDFSVNVQLETETVTRGFSISIKYDPTHLSFVSASQSSVFDGYFIGWWIVNTDTLNTVHVECLIFGAGLSVTGPCNLLNLTFHANAGGYTKLDIDSIYLFDIRGRPIPDVTCVNGDIIIGSQPAYMKSKCWLQGAYSDGAMHTQQNSLIPLTSPYTADPLIAADIPADVVDWVLLELRSTYNGPPVARKSLFQGSDGFLRTPGKSCIILMNTAPGPYYVVLRHRNHLAVMSSSAFLFADNGTAPVLDFSTPANIYGNGGVVEVQTGVVALAAGDADQDGNIAPSDQTVYWRTQTGMSGYLSGDFNLDAFVLPSDLNGLWRTNSGMMSLVPASQ